MTALSYRITRGKHAGQVLSPHAHEDGSFVVSNTRFVADYIRVKSEAELPGWLAKGYRLRMSRPDRAPSLIMPASIQAT